VNISNNGLQLIESFEGLVLHPYKDEAGVPTIGYGTTYYPNGNRVTMDDDSITQEQALTYLEYQVDHTVSASINHFVQVDINQNQFDALASFAYNEGAGALRSSTLLRLLNSGDTAGAADQFLVWDKVRKDGQLVEDDGLLHRRQMERTLFLEPVV
jgi:lysozyme